MHDARKERAESKHGGAIDERVVHVMERLQGGGEHDRKRQTNLESETNEWAGRSERDDARTITGRDEASNYRLKSETRIDEEAHSCSEGGAAVARRKHGRTARVSDGDGKAEGHDVGLWACMCRLLNINADGAESKEIDGIPLFLGGLGLRCAMRTLHQPSGPVDSLSMIKERHPTVAARTVSFLNNVGEARPSSRSAALAAHQLRGVEGFDMPSWGALADGLRLPLRDPEDNVQVG